MCWTTDGLAMPTNAVPTKKPTPAATTGAPTASGDALRQLVLGQFGNVGTFGNKVREAEMGTSVKPKTMGSIKDPTRQS